MKFDLDNEKLNTVYSISDIESEHDRFKFGIVHLDCLYSDPEREFAVGMTDFDNNYFSFCTDRVIEELNPIKVPSGTKLKVRKYIGPYTDRYYAEQIMTVDSENRLYNPDNSLIIVLDVVNDSYDNIRNNILDRIYDILR